MNAVHVHAKGTLRGVRVDWGSALLKWEDETLSFVLACMLLGWGVEIQAKTKKKQNKNTIPALENHESPLTCRPQTFAPVNFFFSDRKLNKV